MGTFIWFYSEKLSTNFYQNRPSFVEGITKNISVSFSERIFVFLYFFRILYVIALATDSLCGPRVLLTRLKIWPVFFIWLKLVGLPCSSRLCYRKLRAPQILPHVVIFPASSSTPVPSQFLVLRRFSAGSARRTSQGSNSLPGVHQSFLYVVSKSLSIVHAADQSKLGGPTTLRLVSYDPEFEKIFLKAPRSMTVRSIIWQAELAFILGTCESFFLRSNRISNRIGRICHSSRNTV